MSRKTKTTATKEEAKPTLVAKLRFPEFRRVEGWKSAVLANACDMQAGKFVSASNILDRNQDGLFPCYGGNGLRGYTATHTHNGTYPLIGRQGALCGNVRLATGQFHATEHAVVATPKEGIDVGWLFYSLDLLNLNRFATGQAQPGLSVDVLENVSVAIPPLEPEQQKIAECLSSVDELMAAQARKVDALKTHKKGLMQQLFPREGETQPRLRFPEFQKAGEWEPTSLGDVARLRNGYAFKSAKYVDDGPYQIITIANVQQGNLTLESTKRIAALPSDIKQHQVLSLGDILISMTGNVGRVCRVTAEGLLLNQRVGKLVPEKIDAAFFYQLLQRDEFRNTMQLKAAGGAQGNLSGGDITEYAFSTPTKQAEQQRIATCLSSLDALITAETQKHEALKTHKKGLMQQLFPSPEEVEA